MPAEYVFEARVHVCIAVSAKSAAEARAAAAEILDAVKIGPDFLAGYNSCVPDLHVIDATVEADESDLELVDGHDEDLMDEDDEDMGALNTVLPDDAKWLHGTRSRDWS